MGDWDSFADDLALAWWISDRDKGRQRAAQKEAVRAAEESARHVARQQQWAFRREVALHSAPLAAQRWEAYVGGFATAADEPAAHDESAIRYLGTLGFTRRAALAALQASGWRGSTTEERTVEAILTPPPGGSS